MTTKRFVYTHNLASANHGVLWYSDNTKEHSICFSNSQSASVWTKRPQIGDFVIFKEDEAGHTKEVYINEEKVYSNA